MKIDTDDVQPIDRSHRHVKICGEPKQPSQREIKYFMQLIQSIVHRSRVDNESSRVHPSQ